MNLAICIAEDAWSWIALLCGNHLGHFVLGFGS
jgi:hypothetical protein